MKDPFLSSIPKDLCKRICKKYQTPKPVGKMRRFENGEVYCGLCDIYMTHDGCHGRNGTPASEYVVPLVCNCCNYRVIFSPKFFKEQFRNSSKVKPEIYNKEKNLEKFDALKKITPVENNLGYLKWLETNEYTTNKNTYWKEKDKFLNEDDSNDDYKNKHDSKMSSKTNKKTDEEILKNLSDLQYHRKIIQELLSKDKNLYEQFESVEKKLKLLKLDEIENVIKDLYD